MARISKRFKNPDEDAKADRLDLLKRVTGGETPAERLARVEREQRDRPTEILDRLRKPRKR
jgi:hypothetical protein